MATRGSIVTRALANHLTAKTLWGLERKKEACSFADKAVEQFRNYDRSAPDARAWHQEHCARR